MHHEEPGHEARRGQAAKPHIGELEQGKIILQGRFGVMGRICFALAHLFDKFPNQKTKNEPRSSCNNKGGTPTKAGGNLSGHHGRKSHPDQGSGTDNNADIAAPGFRFRRRLDHGSHGRKSRALSSAHQRAEKE